MEDKRFAHIANDPKFRRIPKNEKKVKIDKRFQGMFSDSKFKVKYTTDKRGRPVNHTSTEDLKRYYELSGDDSDSESSDDEEKGKFVRAPPDEENELKKKIKNDKHLTNDVKSKLKNLKVDYARGESQLFSESSSDDDSSDEAVSEDEDIDHKWGELDAEADSTEEATNRLAVCNMDWDRIRAVDLLVLFNSFLPPGGVVKCVNIYPSEFGKKRMAEEEIKGPTELLNAKPDEENDDETEEGSKYHMERLRQYQLNRLKYYYAVVTFDSPNSANKIYTECDGMEYESSATKMDLRFIPDDMTFDDDPKETCDNIPDKYEPRFFTTTALQQAKVDLTWDETNPDRMEIAQKLNSGKIDDVTENDLQNYLAGSSDDDDDIEENNEESDTDNEEINKGNAIDKYKALLQDIEDKEFEKKNKDIQMEVTWGLGLKEETEKLVKKKLDQKEEKTPFQQFLDKKKEKRKEKREQRKKKNENSSEENSDVPSDIDMNDPYFAEEFKNSEFKKKKSKAKKEETNSENEDNGELELLLMNEEDNKKHFNLKKIQDEESASKTRKKKNKKKQIIEDTKDDFSVNVNDDRFSALFTSHHFNIDPTDPNFKKTKAMETLITEKLKRRNDDNEEKTIKKPKVEKKSSKNAELSLLVKSVKRKTENFRNK